MTTPAVIQGWLPAHCANPELAATATGLVTNAGLMAAE